MWAHGMIKYFFSFHNMNGGCGPTRMCRFVMLTCDRFHPFHYSRTNQVEPSFENWLRLGFMLSGNHFSIIYISVQLKQHLTGSLQRNGVKALCFMIEKSKKIKNKNNKISYFTSTWPFVTTSWLEKYAPNLCFHSYSNNYFTLWVTDYTYKTESVDTGMFLLTTTATNFISRIKL